MESPDFLEKRYPDLPGSKPVERAVEKARRSPERVFSPHTKDERIQAYLDRIDRIVKDERGWELLKNKIIKEFVIDTEDEETLAKIAHGLYESEKRIAIEQGRGRDIERVPEEGELIEKYKGLVKEKRDVQEQTLNSWLEYLQQNDAEYPTWFSYFVVRNLEKMGTLDKEKGEYSKRTGLTVAPFPEINSEALGFVYRMLTTGIGHQEFTDTPEKRADLAKLIEKKDFIKLYTFAQVETAGALNRESLQGEWIKYNQGSDYHKLEDSLKAKGTGWCTAEGSAYSHLQGGDFYVYYTRGKGGTYSEPRVAIRMEGDSVAEVRGVNHRQELEPDLLDVATTKYHSLPGGEKFDKKSEDMKKVTELVKKQEKNLLFTKDDLLFIYEVNSTIEGFGYDRDPRIAELRKTRNQQEDLPIIFECKKEQIAHNEKEISKDTRAYIGNFNIKVLKSLSAEVKHIYTKFPEEKVFMKEIIPDKEITSDKTAIKKLEVEGHKIGDYSKDMFTKVNWKEKIKDSYQIVSISVGELFGDTNSHTYADIKAKAEVNGLTLVPAKLAPSIRLNYEKSGQWTVIAMEAIRGRDGDLGLFDCSRRGSESWLNYDSGHDGSGWDDYYRFFFARK